MATLQTTRTSALKIDERKRRVESSMTPKIRAIFRHMAEDAQNLYESSGDVSALQLANNYEPEFLSQIRETMRRGLKEFGFDLRTNLEEKHFINFDAEYKKRFIDYEIKSTISLSDTNLPEKVDQINSSFFRNATFFVANESEVQNKYVTDTNAKEILVAIEQEEIAFVDDIARQSQEIQDLNTAESLAVGKERRKIRRKIESATRQLNRSNANQRSIIAKNIRTNLLAKSTARSDLIASQNVGLAESWSRQTEAQLIQDANLATSAGLPINLAKEWVAILDSKTRPGHAVADGQIVPVDQPFTVEGESLMFPRDPNGSASNIINCRCVVNNQIEVGQKSITEGEKKEIDLKPTEEMAKVAKRALEWRKEFNRGGTEVGVARARDISNRTNLSAKTIGRMVSFFARHEVDKEAEGFSSGEDGFPSTGRIAWDLWGGDPGKSWANKKKRQLNKD